MVTKSGANQFHGGLYENFQNTSLNANSFALNAAGKPRPTEHLNQYGGNIGGAVKRGKAVFFFDLNGLSPADAPSNQPKISRGRMRQGGVFCLCYRQYSHVVL